MNNLHSPTNFLLIICLLIFSVVLCKVLIRLVIKMVSHYNILDQPDHRKLHDSPTPSMGGIAVISTMIIFQVIISFYMNQIEWLFITGALVSFSVLGFIDDWKDLNAKLKLVFQISFSVLGYFLGFKLDYAFGLFGVNELPEIISFLLTIGIYILLINAYNLIDGIDQLAGGIIAINFGVFFVFFSILGQFAYVLISVVGLGAILGFLKYNAHPAKIFMGDSGSLPLGMIMSLFTFKVISLLHGSPSAIESSQWILPILVAMNFIPFFDTLRVFILRISKGHSPFIGDRNHLHHLLLKNNLGHIKGALFIHSAHVFIILCLLLIAPYCPLFINLLVVLFLVIIAFEYNTVMRMKIKNKLKSTLNKEESIYLKSNKLLNTLNR